MSINEAVKYKLKLFAAVSIGLFLFILFFQPYGEIGFDYNNRILFIAGLGGISYLFLSIFHIFFPNIFPKKFKSSDYQIKQNILANSLVCTFSSVAFVFYIHYVGGLDISIYLVFKIILTSIAPVAIAMVIYENYILKQITIAKEQKTEAETSPTNETSAMEKVVTFFSDNLSEKIEIQLNKLILMKSADNYVCLFFKENETIKKKLIRNTLKTLEKQLKKYHNYIRCHRSYIVNKTYIDTLINSAKGYKLKMIDFKDDIPVSRQYLLQTKEAINTI